MTYFQSRINIFCKSLIYAQTAILPFCIFISMLIFNGYMGIEPMMQLILYPIGVLCFGAWAIASKYKERSAIVSVGWVLLILFLAVRGLYSPLGFGWQEIMRLCAMAGIILAVSDSDIKFQNICKIILITTLIESIFVFFIEIQWAHTTVQTGARGTMATDNKLASYLMVCLPCSYMIGMMDEKRIWRIIGKIGTIFTVVMLLKSQSRAGVAICIMQVLIISAIYLIMIWNSAKKMVIRNGDYKTSHLKNIIRFLFIKKSAYLAAPITILLLAISLNMDNDELEKIKDISAFHPVYGSHMFDFAKYTKQMVVEHPIIGVGAGKWKQVANSKGLTGVWAHCHNELGQCLAEYGAIGLAICIYLVIIILIFGVQSPIRLIVIMSILLHSFVNGMRTPEDTFYFALFYGMIFQHVVEKETV